jgi:ribosomal protein S12 methylthiotransferase accessory factor YcaO
MLSLASLRYRNVLAAHGGPISHIETGEFPVRGRRVYLANARLTPGLVRKGRFSLFSDADGSGTHVVPGVARHKAVSEAMERWAFYTTVRSERAADFAFDVDPSTCGMSAFPGLLRRHARRTAVLEAIERFSLIAWWEGRARGRLFETDWPGVSAVAVDGPLGGVTVITYARSEWGGYVYGHAAEESFGAACEHAVVELARHEWMLRACWLAAVAGEKKLPANLFERRCLFFSSDEGHELFQQRVTRTTWGAMPRPEILCDRDVPGPWDEYATVWRFALRPFSDGYLHGGESYFFL